MINLAIVGCRKYQDYDVLKYCVEEWIKENNNIDTIISGGATGVDSLAQQYATENDIPIIIHSAEWQKYGKNAGPKRNTKIVNDATHVLALPSKDSKGTWDTIRKAQAVKKPVTINRI